MKIPKGCDIQIKTTEGEMVELQINASITTKTQAKELTAAITRASALLEGERRQRRSKVAAVQAA